MGNIQSQPPRPSPDSFGLLLSENGTSTSDSLTAFPDELLLHTIKYLNGYFALRVLPLVCKRLSRLFQERGFGGSSPTADDGGLNGFIPKFISDITKGSEQLYVRPNVVTEFFGEAFVNKEITIHAFSLSHELRFPQLYALVIQLGKPSKSTKQPSVDVGELVNRLLSQNLSALEGILLTRVMIDGRILERLRKLNVKTLYLEKCPFDGQLKLSDFDTVQKLRIESPKNFAGGIHPPPHVKELALDFPETPKKPKKTINVQAKDCKKLKTL
jgi:hypothetical protein